MQHGHLVQITEIKVQYYSVRMTTYPRVLVQDNNTIIIKQHFLKEYSAEIVFTRIYLGEKYRKYWKT